MYLFAIIKFASLSLSVVSFGGRRTNRIKSACNIMSRKFSYICYVYKCKQR